MGSNVGINDTVTSIGINYTNNSTNFDNKIAYDDQSVFIGTTKGTYSYNSTTGSNVVLQSNKYYGKVYEATYRSTIYSGYSIYDPPGDTILYQQAVFETPFYGNGYGTWQSAHEYGNQLNTTYCNPVCL